MQLDISPVLVDIASVVTFTSAWSVGSGLHDLGNIQQLLRDFAVLLGAMPSVSFVCHSFIDLQGMPCPVVPMSLLPHVPSQSSKSLHLATLDQVATTILSMSTRLTPDYAC